MAILYSPQMLTCNVDTQILIFLLKMFLLPSSLISTYTDSLLSFQIYVKYFMRQSQFRNPPPPPTHRPQKS